ncbi:MAG: ATP-grasp domain-containing protein [Candidatus Levyibacteriota bacterium]
MDHPKTAEVLFAEAKKMGLQPTWLTDYGLFSFPVEEKTGYVFYARNMFNSNLSGFLAIDKHATRTVLQQHHFPNIPYGMFSTHEEVEQFLQQHQMIVAKPVFGSTSKDVHVIRSSAEIPDIPFDKYIFEKFIKGREMRYLVFQSNVVAVHEKSYEGLINIPAKVRRIAYPKKQWDERLVQLSEQITDTLFMKFAAVDYLIDDNGKAFFLEVNSSPGLYFFEHPTSGPGINIARMFLEETVKAIKKK